FHGIGRRLGQNRRPFGERDDRYLVLRAVRHLVDERFDPDSDVAYVVARRLTVVDQDGNLHRIVGGSDSQHLAGNVVLPDQEIGRAQIRYRRVGFVEDADIYRSLDRLSTRRGGE